MASDSDNVLIVHVPSLVATLWAAEKEKGAPLTEQEVLDIRDNSPAIAMRPSELQEVEASRGYQDIDPEQCWAEWQAARKNLLAHERESGEES